MGYPCCRYHATEPMRVVTSEAAEQALGPGWYDSPKRAAAALAAARPAPHPVTPPPPPVWGRKRPKE